MFHFLWPHGLQHTSFLCPPLFPRVCSDSCPLYRWCYLTISSSATPFCFAFDLAQHQSLFLWAGSSHTVTKVLELQHQSFQWIFRVDFLQDWLAWSPWNSRDSQESSPEQFKSINSSVLSLLYGPTLTSVLDYWKNIAFTIRTFVSKVAFLLFNTLSRFVNFTLQGN